MRIGEKVMSVEEDVNASPSVEDSAVFSAYTCTSLDNIDIDISNLKHPGNVVEAASLAAVALPKSTYTLALPKEVITKSLSSLQLESVVCACSKFAQILPSGERAGFCIGDGAGIGKGRTIAAILVESYCRGFGKSLWVSTSSDLYYDACRDMKDLGAHLPIIRSIQDMSRTMNRPPEGILFATYSTLTRSNRLEQIIDWLGESFSGCIIFDEAHKAKHGSTGESGQGTLVAAAVLSLQKRLPSARVVYASATGISEIKNMAYLSRLNLYGPHTPFKTFEDMVRTLNQKDLCLLELLSQDLKMQGYYVARNFSYQGAEFQEMQVKLSDSQIEMYDQAVTLWRTIRDEMNQASRLTHGNQKGRMWNKVLLSSQQRFFKSLCVSIKVDDLVKDARKGLEEGHCIVIGLQSTGEAAFDQLDLKPGVTLSDVISVTKEILINLVQNHFPTHSFFESSGRMVEEPECIRKQEMLLERIDKACLPGNPLDLIIDELGGASAVAEMTGRRGRLLRVSKNSWKYEIRGSDLELDSVNVLENQAFNSGKKLVAIVSDAASTGISLHASKMVANQRRRIHYTLELPWSADKAIQQIGRSHRSNQTSAPIYKLMITDLGGERRFAAAVAKRLESLGALTRGDRRAASGFNLDSMNFDSIAGKVALQKMLRHIENSLNVPPHGVPLEVISSINGLDSVASGSDVQRFHAKLNEFIEEMEIEMSRNVDGDKIDSSVIRKFFNRLLAAPVGHQKMLFAYFEAIMKEEKKQRDYQTGHMYYRHVSRESEPTVLWEDNFGLKPTVQHDLIIDRGLSWDDVILLHHLHLSESDKNGFYLSRRPLPGTNIRSVCFIMLNLESKKYTICRPSTGKSTIEIFMEDVGSKYHKVDPEDAKEKWMAMYEASTSTCIHGGGCHQGQNCMVGRRLLTTTLLSGSIVRIWDVLETVLEKHKQNLTRLEQSMRIMRYDSLGGDDTQSIVGLRYPRNLLPEVLQTLSSDDYQNAHNCGNSKATIEDHPPIRPGMVKKAFKPSQKSMHDFFSKKGQPPLKKPRTQRISEENLGKIMDMGFSKAQASRALIQCKNSLDRAVQHLLENNFVDLS